MSAAEHGATRRRAPVLLLAALAVLAAGFVLRAVLQSQRPPDGPQPVAWDRTACTRCRMLVSEPRFAAQAHGKSGEIHHFDDPGCALLWASENGADVHELWFHELESDGWLRRAEVAFVEVTTTPMGYGLGARPATTANALTPDAALKRLLTAEDGRENAPR